MANVQIDTISREELKNKIEQTRPDNASRSGGYALVNVLNADSFEKEHIPGSINIPQGKEDEFENRFGKMKEIIVYCASPDCSASPKAAEELTKRGFVSVRDYEGGMSDWKEAGNEVESGKA
jgi:rhodanese-related sulfurtransferase